MSAETGDLYSCGSGASGRLGHSELTSLAEPSLVNHFRGEVVDAGAGEAYSVLVDAIGRFFMSGQLHLSETVVWTEPVVPEAKPADEKDKTAPIAKPTRWLSVTGLNGTVKRFSCGLTHVAVITQQGTLYTWGNAANFRCGHGDLPRDSDATVLVPTVVESLSSIHMINVACGPSWTGAISDLGELYTWGCGKHSVLGHGTTDDQKFPRRVEGLVGQGLRLLACGAEHMIACSASHTWTWGSGTYGQLGHSNTLSHGKPTRLVSLTGNSAVEDVAAGFYHNIVVSKSAEVFTWGRNSSNCLGNGSSDEVVATPTAVVSLEGQSVKKVAAGAHHTLAITVNGHISSWGLSESGALGLATDTQSTAAKYVETPTRLHSLGDMRVRCAAAGPDHTVIVTIEKQTEMIPGIVCPPKCAVRPRASEMNFRAGQNCQFYIAAKDALGDKVTAGGDRFTVRMRSEGAVLNPLVSDSGGGNYCVTFVPTVAGSYKTEITLAGRPIATSPFQANVTAGAISPASCTAVGDGLFCASSGQTTEFTIVGRDQYGNVLDMTRSLQSGQQQSASATGSPNGETDFTVRLIGSEEPVDVIVEDRSDGTYVVTYKPMAAGHHLLSVTLRHSADPDAAFFGKGGAGAVKGAQIVTSHILNSPFSLLVSPGPLNAMTCEQIGGGIDDPYSDMDMTYTIVSKDMAHNRLTSGGAAFTVNMQGINSTLEATVTDCGDGTYTVLYNTDTPGSYKTNIQATTGTTIANAAPFDLIVKHMKFASGARPPVGHGDSSKAHAPKCIASGDGVLGCVAGMSTSFTVDSRDSLNNLRTMGGDLFTARLEGKSNINVPIRNLGQGKYVGEYSTDTSGNYLLSIRLDDIMIDKSPFDVRAAEGPMSILHSWAKGDGLVGSAAGTYATFTIVTRDSCNNELSTGGKDFVVKLIGPQPLIADVQDEGDGTYTCSYKAVKSGLYMVGILEAESGGHIRGSPFKTRVKPGELNAGNCEAMGTGLRGDSHHRVPLLQTSYFDIQAKDAFGNNLVSGGSEFLVQLSGADALTGEVNDNANGTYRVQYTPQDPGEYRVSCLVSGVHIQGSPFAPVVVVSESKDAALGGGKDTPGSSQKTEADEMAATQAAIAAQTAASDEQAGFDEHSAMSAGKEVKEIRQKLKAEEATHNLLKRQMKELTEQLTRHEVDSDKLTCTIKEQRAERESTLNTFRLFQRRLEAMLGGTSDLLDSWNHRFEARLQDQYRFFEESMRPQLKSLSDQVLLHSSFTSFEARKAFEHRSTESEREWDGLRECIHKVVTDVNFQQNRDMKAVTEGLEAEFQWSFAHLLDADALDPEKITSRQRLELGSLTEDEMDSAEDEMDRVRRLMSPSDVLACAVEMNMNVQEHPDLLWIAEELLDAPLPVDWSVTYEQRPGSSKIRQHCKRVFHNVKQQVTTSKHPCMDEYKQKYMEACATKAQGASLDSLAPDEHLGPRRARRIPRINDPNVPIMPHPAMLAASIAATSPHNQ